MTYTDDQLWDLLRQAYDMPYGAAHIALLEQVIAQADARALAALSFEARIGATTAYVYGGEPAKAFVTFSWCLTEFDRDPTRYAKSQHSLLWDFKFMVTGMTKFPEIPLDRAYAVLDDMERRWRSGGHSMHAVYAYRHEVARHVGDFAAAQQWFDLWSVAPRDDLSDCVGCDPSAKVGWLAAQGRDDEAIALAESILSGQLTCTEQPQSMLTGLLKPYLRTGRLDQARDAHRRAYRLHRPNLADLVEIADHVEFCALTGNEARGVEIVERHLRWLDRAPTPLAAMRFAAASALLLRRAALGSDTSLYIVRPAHGDRPCADMPVEELADQLREFALGQAARFDARNGTPHQTNLTQATVDASPIVDHLPLSTTTAAPKPSSAGTPSPGAAGVPARTGSSADLPPVPPTASPEELLDLAEDHFRRGRLERAFAAWHAFDERYLTADLTVGQRAQRADGHGVEAATQDSLAEAETAWRSAVELFGQAGDEVRRHSARSRIGRLWCAKGRGDEGLAMVEEATSYLLAHATPDRWAGALLAVASAQLSVSRPEEALATLERAERYLEFSVDTSMPMHVAMMRAQGLSLLGRFEEASRAAHDAVRVGRHGSDPNELARANMLLARTAEQLNDLDGAVAAYEEAGAAATNIELARVARMHRSGLLAITARAPEVVDDLVNAIAERTAQGDAEGAAGARHTLAIACLNADRELDGVEAAEESLAWYAAHAPSGSNLVVSLRHLLATLYDRLGQHDDAIAQLELISAECAEQGNHAGVGQMAEEIGEILDGLDRDSAAATYFLTAARSFGTAELPIEEFRNLRQHAMSVLWSGDADGAVAALSLADDQSHTLPDDAQAVWEKAVLLYDGAKILRGIDRLPEAGVRMGNAAAAFRAINALAQSAHAETLCAELLLETHQPAGAEAAARRALAELPENSDAREHLRELLAATIKAQGREG